MTVAELMNELAKHPPDYRVSALPEFCSEAEIHAVKNEGGFIVIHTEFAEPVFEEGEE